VNGNRGPTDGGNRERTIDRRSVLKGATTGAVALTGMTAFTGSASAGSCIALTAADAPDDFPMIEDGETRGDFPEGPDELVIFVHGWFEELGGDAVGQSYLTSLALEDAGYDGDVVGFQYDGNNPWWWEAKDDAEDGGRGLADWLEGYMSDHPDTDVLIVCHSLGARASLTCLDELQSRGESVTSISLLGAAVDADSVTDGWWSTGDFYDAVDSGADDVYNYRSDDDAILEYIYSIGEFGDEALGEEGADGDAPGNYEDIGVTDQVGDHCEYFQPDTGCIDRVVEEF
jgi:pimeloyl-ACP methyl ester carboxylesterase